MSAEFEHGLSIRKEVLGDEYVDAALKNANAFTRPLQELITEYAWGAVWGRSGLERRERSLLNIALLSALDRQPELALHIRGAITNGVSVKEIREVIIHVSVYCGAPAALEATRTAAKTLADLGIDLDAEELNS